MIARDSFSAAIEARRAQDRETLRKMSDQGIRHQLSHGAFGGTQREAIVAEAKRRGIIS